MMSVRVSAEEVVEFLSLNGDGLLNENIEVELEGYTIATFSCANSHKQSILANNHEAIQAYFKLEESDGMSFEEFSPAELALYKKLDSNDKVFVELVKINKRRPSPES